MTMNLVEIKARTDRADEIRDILRLRADFKGVDNQIDTYFNSNNGRLKLREGNIENNLIYYDREDKKGPKNSKVILFKSEPGSSIKKLLTESLGILTVIDKKREIYFIDNVKLHIDEVKGLGNFVEIEAIDEKGDIGKEKLSQQCNQLIRLLEIKEDEMISASYSDMLLNKAD